MRSGSRLTALTPLLFAASSAFSGAALAEEVVLDNGKVLVGRVVSDDGKTVRIETANGSMTIDKCRVREIRKDPAPVRPGEVRPSSPPPTKSPAPAPPASAPAGGTSPAPDATGERPGRQTRSIADALAELERVVVVPWTEPPPDVLDAPRPETQTWRVQFADGQMDSASVAPRTAENIQRVWHLRRLLDETKDGKPRQAEWTRMTWREDGRFWVAGPPESLAYARDEQLSREIATRVATWDTKSWVECDRLVWDIARKRAAAARDAPADVTELRKKLLDAATAATGSAESGRAAVRVLEIETEAQRATPDEKVRLATERRVLIRKLVANAR